MNIFQRIFGWLTGGLKAIFNFVRNRGLSNLIEDTGKAVTGIATIGTVGFAAFNAAKVMLSKRRNDSKETEGQSPNEILLNHREAGTDQKLARAKSFNFRTGTSLTDEDLDLLAEVSKTRNAFFKGMSPDEQMNLLHIEGFDFDAFREEMAKKNRRGIFYQGGRRIGEATPPDQPWRTEVNYGILTPIARVLDDFICWLKGDPTPKKCEQVKIIDRSAIPEIEGLSVMETIRVMNSIESVRSASSTDIGSAGTVLDEIMAKEIFRHKTPKAFRQEVEKKMLEREGVSSSLYSLLGKELEHRESGKGKNKSGKHKDGKGGKDKSTLKELSATEGKLSKKQEEALTESADELSKRLYKHHLKVAVAGKQDYTGYNMDKIFG